MAEADEVAGKHMAVEEQSSAQTEDAEPVSPPDQHFRSGAVDSGWAAWSVVAGGWCAMFVSVGWNNSVGIFQTIYENDQLHSYSTSAVGWVNSLQTFVMFACAPICGKVFDSYGPRPLMAGGAIFLVFGLMMMSLSTQYYQFMLSQSICTGIGAGAVFFSASNSIATWFKRHRALALGIASSGSSTGGIVIP